MKTDKSDAWQRAIRASDRDLTQAILDVPPHPAAIKLRDDPEYQRIILMRFTTTQLLEELLRREREL